MAENSVLDCVSLKDIKLSLLFSYLCQHIIFTIHHRFEDIVEKEKENQCLGKCKNRSELFY